MAAIPFSKNRNTFLYMFISCIFIGMLLVTLGWIFFPSTAVLSVAGTLVVLAVYGLIAFFIFPKISPGTFKIAGLFGLMGGIVFFIEIMLEYIVLPKDNSSWGLIEYGFILIILFICSLVVSWRQRSFRKGVIATVASAMISSIFWLIFMLVIFYLFHGSARQILVFQAEGNFVDFTRSGMKDFDVFIMEDFLGAGFFHLLLLPVISVILGAIGGFFGNWISKSKT